MLGRVLARDLVVGITWKLQLVEDRAEFEAPLVELSIHSPALNNIRVFVEVGKVAFERNIVIWFHLQTRSHRFEGAAPIVQLQRVVAEDAHVRCVAATGQPWLHGIVHATNTILGELVHHGDVRDLESRQSLQVRILIIAQAIKEENDDLGG